MAMPEIEKPSPENTEIAMEHSRDQNALNTKGAAQDLGAKVVIPSAAGIEVNPASTVQVPKMAEQIIDSVRHNNQLIGQEFTSGGQVETDKPLTQEQLAVQSVQNDLNQWLGTESGKAWLDSEQGQAWKETANSSKDSLTVSGQYDSSTEALVGSSAIRVG